MVSLNQKVTIEEALLSSPKANAFFCYLNNQEIVIPETELNNNEESYYSLLIALAKQDKRQFSKRYDEISKRKPVIEQPIIYDNYFIFILIVGVCKFNLDNAWIKSILTLRNTVNEPEKSITTSFVDFLNKNIYTTNGITSVVLAGLVRSNDDKVDETVLKNALESNKKITLYLERDLFLASIYLFTNDYIISLSIGKDANRLKLFEKTFLNRVEILQNVFLLIILASLIKLWFFIGDKFPAIKQFSSDLATILGILGLGTAAFVLNKIKDKFGGLIKMFFGYRSNKELSTKEKS